MNIFFLDSNFELAAQYLGNKHLVKAVLETAQLLSTAQHLLASPVNETKVYRATHVNHPINKWCRANCQNYEWTCRYGLALCKEYTFRYSKRHKSQNVIEYCYNNYPYNLPLAIDMTPPAQAMPDEYKGPNTIEGVVEAYRRYYREDKMRNVECKWTKRKPPEWLEDL